MNSRRIVMLTYPGAELLDLSGPSGVFSTANRMSRTILYEVVTASSTGGIVTHSCGIGLDTVPLYGLTPGPRDTVLVVGADARPLALAMANADLKNCLIAASQRAERFGSICTGVFVLAAADLLTGKAVATHWSAKSQLRRLFPQIRCDADTLYVTENRLWTSAGVTTGIDMALAMLERDHGAALKATVARQLVVYAHRPGHQSQFSDLLAAQGHEDERFARLAIWLSESIAAAVPVESMAEHVGMSLRTFHRRFTSSFGQTPAKFFERLRLDAARRLLEGRLSVAKTVRRVGFQSESAFRAAFKAEFGVTPQLYRETWQNSEALSGRTTTSDP